MDREHRSARRTRTALALRLGLTVAALALVAACVPPPVEGPPGPGPIDRRGVTTLQNTKATHFSEVLSAQASQIRAGTASPLVGFTVESSPPSIFVNWIVPDERAEAFFAEAGLAPGFELAKVRILESDPEPRYWLSLNVYRVSGITTGVRAEWSTYVDDGDGDPRFMILQARAAEGSLDPIGPLALPEPFTHRSEPDGTIRTTMRATELRNGVPVLTNRNLFTSTITLPQPEDRTFVVPSDEWVTANDFIYWVNGVNDRVFYDASAHSAPLLSVDLDAVELLDDSVWAPYLDPAPAHVLVYLDEIRFVISPWWNVTELDGRVDPATVSSLRSLKRTIYGGMTEQMALGVRLGSAEPVLGSAVAADAPSTHWHWRVPPERLEQFAAAVGLAPGLSLASVPLEVGEQPEHWLSLHVYERTGEGAGTRAEWSTHVHDGTAVRELVLDSHSSRRWLDPVSLFSPGTTVQQATVGDEVRTELDSGTTRFSSAFVAPSEGDATGVRPSRVWVAAGDLRYWRNGVADQVLYDGGRLAVRTSIDPAGVQVEHSGPWSSFSSSTPDRVWLDRGGSAWAATPWINLARLPLRAGG